MQPPRPHWLSPAGRSKSPTVTVCFDTETVAAVSDGNQVLRLRCWDAITRTRQAGLEDGSWCVHSKGEAAGQLAACLEAAAGVTGEAWAFAHNAGFDLTVTSLPMVLTFREWQPEFVNLGDETCVFVMKRDRQRLVITDTWSWLRCSLDQAARDVGMRKTRLPNEGDSLSAWHHRCRHDVEILDRLVSRFLDWWDGQGLGSFAVTGSSCGWRTLRAKTPPKSILVGPAGSRTDFEREAIYGGRKEVWQVGRFRGRWVDDWDLHAAHLTTVASKPMPVVPMRLRGFGRPPDALNCPSDLGAVCRVRIATRRPVAPVRVKDETWWPVGEFETVITTAELSMVVELADSVTVLEASWYRLSEVMAPWALWCLELQSQQDTAVPRVVKRVAKGWGRSVPGRFALRTSQLLWEREATHLGWALETGHDLTTGDPIEVVTYGGVERTYRKDADGRDVSPVVLAFVEGYVRAAMAATIGRLPAGLLLQVNTDGWWQTRQPRRAAPPTESVPDPYRAVLKATARDVTVRGPNHIDSRGDRRLAGVPADAHQALDGTFSWQDWPGLRWQMQHSRPGEYLRPGREMMLQDHYCRRWVLTSGETVPVTASLSRATGVELLPWSETSGRLDSDRLAEHQVQALSQLADDDPDPVSLPPSLPSQPGRIRP